MSWRPDVLHNIFSFYLSLQQLCPPHGACTRSENVLPVHPDLLHPHCLLLPTYSSRCFPRAHSRSLVNALEWMNGKMDRWVDSLTKYFINSLSRWYPREWGHLEPFLSNKFKQHLQVNRRIPSWTELSLEIKSNMQISGSVKDTAYCLLFPTRENFFKRPTFLIFINKFLATFLNLFTVWLQKHVKLWPLSTIKFFFLYFKIMAMSPASETIMSLNNIYKMNARTHPFWVHWKSQIK